MTDKKELQILTLNMAILAGILTLINSNIEVSIELIAIGVFGVGMCNIGYLFLHPILRTNDRQYNPSYRILTISNTLSLSYIGIGAVPAIKSTININISKFNSLLIIVLIIYFIFVIAYFFLSIDRIDKKVCVSMRELIVFIFLITVISFSPLVLFQII